MGILLVEVGGPSTVVVGVGAGDHYSVQLLPALALLRTLALLVVALLLDSILELIHV